MNPVLVPQYGLTGANIAALVESSGSEQTLRCEGAWPQAFLSSVRAGSAGVVVLITGYGPYLPHVGTSPAVADHRLIGRVASSAPAPAEQSSFQDALTLSVAEQVREVLAALSLNKSQLAEVLGVSRPTLYDWFEGKEPNASNCERLATLLRLLTGAGVTSSSPLNARFVRQRLSEDGASLLDSLRAEMLDEGKLMALLRDARLLGDRAESRRTRREDRLRALGFEDPSDEQRRDQLARNVAMRDWPKL